MARRDQRSTNDPNENPISCRLDARWRRGMVSKCPRVQRGNGHNPVLLMASPGDLRTGSHLGATLASGNATRQTRGGLRKALRETLPVTRSIRTLLLLTLMSAATHADAVNIVTGSVGATSDFVFRGLSLTRGKPAAQA